METSKKGSPTIPKVKLGLLEQFLTYLSEEKHFSRYTVMNYSADLCLFFLRLAERESLPFEVRDGGQRVATTASGERSDALAAAVLRQQGGDLKLYTKWLEGEFGSSTVSRRVASLRSFYRWLHSRRLISVNPALVLKSPGVNRRKLAKIDEVSLERLRTTPRTTSRGGARDRAALGILYDTGIRTSELTALNQGDLDGRLISVGVRKKRRLQLSERTLHDLEVYFEFPGISRQPGDPLLVGKTGTRISDRNFRRAFVKHLKRAGLPASVRITDIRHFRAIFDLARGVGLSKVCQNLGVLGTATLERHLEVVASNRQSA